MQPGAQVKPIRSQIYASVVLLLLSYSVVAQQTSINGNVISIPVVLLGEQAFQVELTLVADTNPIELMVTAGNLLAEFNTEGASTFDGTTLVVPSIDVDGVSYWANFNLVSTEPPIFIFVDAAAVSATPPQSCTRPDPDPSHGPDNPSIIAGFSIPPSQIEEGGPGPDGIPSIDNRPGS